MVLTPEMKVAAVALAWPIVSGIANAILGQKTDEQWVEFAEKNPRLAALSKVLKAVGLNPVGAVKALRNVFAKKVQ